MFWMGILFLIASKWFINEAFGLSPTASWLVFIGVFLLMWWLYILLKKEIINNRVFFENPFSASSYANYANLTNGIKWACSGDISNAKEGVKIDKYKFDWSVKKHFSALMEWFVDGREKDIIIKNEAFKKGSLVIGQMGAGKTVFLNNLLFQKWYKRAILHDVKGDYVQKFYKSNKDVILNPFDKRGSLWDIFAEARYYPQIIKPFFSNLISGVGGKETNFFTGSASDRYIHIFNVVLSKELETKESWQMLIDNINKYFEEVKNDPNAKSEKDVVQTMKLIVEFFEYQNFLIQNGAKTFTIARFLKSKDAKLFLLNNQSYFTFLNPYFSGFISAFTNIFMSTTKDNTEELTLFLLDEYLTFLPILDEGTLTTIHTLIRSKGGCLFPAVQYVPTYDKKLQQKLMNSVDHLFVFQTADAPTIQIINEIIGKVDYQSTNKSYSGGDINESVSTHQSELLSDDIIKGLGADFTHLTLIPSRKILYKGYTEMLKLEDKNEGFVEAKYKEYLLNKYKEK